MDNNRNNIYERNAVRRVPERRPAREKNKVAAIVLIAVLAAAFFAVLIFAVSAISAPERPAYIKDSVSVYCGAEAITPEDFLSEGGHTVSFVSGRYDLDKVGTYKIKLAVDGKKYKVRVCVLDPSEIRDPVANPVLVIEAGNELPGADAFTGISGLGRFVSDVSLISSPPVGSYMLEIEVAGKVYDVTLEVRDTVPPRAEIRTLFWSEDEAPSPSLFFAEIYDASSVVATYTSSVPQCDKEGRYDNVSITLTDAVGNATVYTCTLVVDKTPPEIGGFSSEINIEVGDAIAYRNGITVTDDSGEDCELWLDASQANVNAAGEYIVYYVARDKAGNETRIRAVLTVMSEEHSEAELNEIIKPIVDELIKGDMSDEEKLKAINLYIKYNITYEQTGTSHVDWRSEAYRGLRDRTGSCYTYYAVSRAFLTYLGYENIRVEKAPEYAEISGVRHYWNMVNIGTSESPLWYHFDATPIAGNFRIWSYLLTDAQLAAYTNWRNTEKVDAAGVPTCDYFYQFDPTLYPASATEEKVSVEEIPKKYFD